jgi:hypothetical protein
LLFDPRRRVVAFLALLAFFIGSSCRSSQPKHSPSDPSTAPPVASAPAPRPDPVPPAPPSGAGIAEEAEDPASDAELAEGDGTDAAAAIQQEALDLCQSAQEAVERGELDQALATVDRVYALMLTLPADNGSATGPTQRPASRSTPSISPKTARPPRRC